MKIQISRTPENLNVAADIIRFLATGEGAPHNPIITLEGDRLRFTSDLHPLNDGEIVVNDGLQRDHYGDFDGSEAPELVLTLIENV